MPRTVYTQKQNIAYKFLRPFLNVVSEQYFIRKFAWLRTVLERCFRKSVQRI